MLRRALTRKLRRCARHQLGASRPHTTAGYLTKEISMARYQCRACGFDDHAAWDGNLVCPRCGNRSDVRAAIGREEFTEAEVAAIIAATPDKNDVFEDDC